MNFCPNCGAAAAGTPFCGNCGQPMTTRSDAPLTEASRTTDEAFDSGASATAAAGASPRGTGDGSVAPGRAGATAGAAARTNPFADIPVSDYVRDAIALVLLLVSFGMPWDLSDTVTGKVYVLLVTLLSVVSLSLPYLKRGGVLPATWGTAQLRLARLGANVPYVVVVLITFILAYVGDGVGDGIGVGIAFGLAGAILAAQGRQAEQAPGGDAPVWRLVSIGIGAVFALMTAISIVIFLTDVADGLDWEEVAYVVLIVMVFFLALAAVPGIGAIRREDAAWRDVLILLGVVALFIGVWQLSAEGTLADAWSLRQAGPQLVLVPALAAATSAAALCASARRGSGAAHWVAASIRALQLVVVVAGFAVLQHALRIIAREEGRGVGIVALVLYLIVMLAAVVGRNALTRDANLGRAVALICGTLLVVVGVVVASVLGASEAQVVNLADATAISVLWWFGVAVIVALTTPKSVRDELGPVSAPQAAFAGPSADTPAGDSMATSRQAASSGGDVRAADGREEPGSARSAAMGSAGHVASSQPPAKDVDDAPERTSRTGQQVTGDGTGGEESSPAAEGSELSGPSGSGALDDSTTILSSTPGRGEGDEPELLAGSEPATGAHRAAPPAGETGPVQEAATRVDQPAVAYQPGREKTAQFSAQMAADPNTPLQTLADIAAQEPALRPHVASNPSAYPELLAWLGQLGDPEVDKALRRRPR